MGLATAKVLGQSHNVIIAGRSMKKLEQAVEELTKIGIACEVFPCDISNQATVNQLAAYAKSRGEVSIVINSAGMSPHMGDAKTIMEVNALGTIYINEAFYPVMGEGGCLIDISSMSAYMIPEQVIPMDLYKYSRIDIAEFMNRMMERIEQFPLEQQSNIAYGVSKNFIIWYARADASKFGEKGIRILSVSPGAFETPMGEMEKESIAGYIDKFCAVKRLGNVDEIASLLEFCTSKQAGYLTGTDILCDGGCVAGWRSREATFN